MNCTRQNLKHLIFLVVFALAPIHSTLAAKIAQITIPKAIIYADEALTSPLGHVSNGKLIPVGSPLEKNPDIVPVIISGRLAYVHIQDIRYVSKEDEELEKRRGAPREHRIDEEFLTVEDKLTENNYFSFGFGSMEVGEDVKNFFINVDGVEKTSATRLYADFIHRNPINRFGFGVGIEYITVSSSNAGIAALFINPQVSFSLIRIKKLNIETYGVINIGAGNTIKVDNNFANEPRGWFFGGEVGLRGLFPISNKWSLIGSVGIKNLKAFDITGIEYGDGTQKGDINSMGGIGYLLGLSYFIQ